MDLRRATVLARAGGAPALHSADPCASRARHHRGLQPLRAAWAGEGALVGLPLEPRDEARGLSEPRGPAPAPAPLACPSSGQHACHRIEDSSVFPAVWSLTLSRPSDHIGIVGACGGPCSAHGPGGHIDGVDLVFRQGSLSWNCALTDVFGFASHGLAGVRRGQCSARGPGRHISICLALLWPYGVHLPTVLTLVFVAYCDFLT
mmetsp:Transcript_117144/g.364784  ORF Transcript_117144/g.364784 Transcript_117144/m.364784 type:complete len:204 (-) Transcript_117144:586-1197(-)